MLQRLRRKVQRGERLSEADMRRLRTAADVEGGSALSIALGLALSNAASDDEALEVLLRAGPWEHRGLRATWIEAVAGTGDLLARVVPVLAEAAGPGLLSREGPAGLAVTYLVDGVPLATDAAPDSLEAVDAAAWAHLEAGLADPRPVIVDRGQPRLSPEALGLWTVCEADGADGARLLTAGQRRRLFEVAGPGPYRISLVRPELALLAPLLDPSAVGLLESVEARPGGVGGRFALQPDGNLQRLGG